MPTLILEIFINAPPETCFDLMRDIRIHTQTTLNTNERAAAGVTDGKIELGQTVTFEGTHFGLKQRFTAKVVEFDRPRRFVDEMVQGAFKSFRHIHEFEPRDGGTLMTDTLFWESPLGFLGTIFDKLALKRHMRNLVSGRNARLKEIAENAGDKDLL